MNYHIYLEDVDGRKHGEYYGPKPAAGEIVSTVIEADEPISFLVLQVHHHVNRMSDNIPFVTKLTVIVQHGEAINEEQIVVQSKVVDRYTTGDGWQQVVMQLD